MPPRTSFPTIYDVAAEAGVAPSTVSRAFSRPERVSVRTRAHVLAAADRIGYRPGALPPRDTGRRHGTFVVTVGDIANPYVFDIVRTAEQRAATHAYTITICDSGESVRMELDNLRHQLTTAAGAVLAASRLCEEILVECARARPLVLLNRRVEGLNSILADSAPSFRRAVRELHRLGHHQVHYLAGPQRAWCDAVRWQAIRDQCAALGMRATRSAPQEPVLAAGAQAAERGFPTGTTAVLAYNDLLALGVLLACQARGRRVPEDLSVIGCDDIFNASFANPPLSTIAMPGKAAGEKAIDLLIGQVTGRIREPVTLTLPTRYRPRRSTGPAPRG